MKKWLLRIALVVLAGLGLIVGVVLAARLAAQSEIQQAQQAGSTAVPLSIGTEDAGNPAAVRGSGSQRFENGTRCRVPGVHGYRYHSL